MAKRTRKAGGLATVTTSDLAAELARRSRQVTTLERKRDKLVAQLEEVEAELAEFGALSAATGGGGRRGGGKRPKNDMTLEDALAQVLSGTVMGVSEVAEAVQAAGYKTSSPNFRTIVNQTLLKNKKKFKKQGRGRYTAA